MTVKIITCAALLLAACGGAQPAKEETKAPETRTEVKHGAEIALLKPDSKAGMTVNEALENRRSWREYAPEALSLEELSGVMWAAGGVNRPADGRLTAPSALALYPVRVYAFFAEGVYSYDAKARKLVRVAEGDLRRLAGAQDFVYAAPPCRCSSCCRDFSCFRCGSARATFSPGVSCALWCRFWCGACSTQSTSS